LPSKTGNNSPGASHPLHPGPSKRAPGKPTTDAPSPRKTPETCPRPCWSCVRSPSSIVIPSVARDLGEPREGSRSLRPNHRASGSHPYQPLPRILRPFIPRAPATQTVLKAHTTPRPPARIQVPVPESARQTRRTLAHFPQRSNATAGAHPQTAPVSR